MRIKRFIAPDMRSALRMVRDEQGPDAVILSTRAIDDGTIEVVAATDYDESLVQQALRAAAPGLETIAIAAVDLAGRASESAPLSGSSATFGSIAAQLAAAAPNQHHGITATATTTTTTATPATMTVDTTAIAERAAAPAARESLVARARAVFKISDGPTLAELAAAALTPAPSHAASSHAAQAIAPAAHLPSSLPAIAAANDATAGLAAPEPTRFEAMMAALNNTPVPVHAPAPVAPRSLVATASAARAPATTAPATTTFAITANAANANAAHTESAPASTTARAGVAAPASARFDADEWAAIDSDYHVTLSAVTAPVAPRDEVVVAEIESIATPLIAAVAAAPALQIVANAEPDPSIVAMRADLATMRVLMERQMEQLSVERLRGSPARAAAYDALIGYGCEDVLAQAVAAKIDPRLDPAQIQAPMFAELARMLTIARSEPLDDGGVIALVGPTGAGKTTTAAKLAARFAARHRARDVALVTTDNERAGAREQLHAHGRRLGITVCEAAGPEGLQEALAQLTDYPLVLVDTTGHAPRDRALFAQILWLRAARKVRSLLVLPANAHPHDLGEVIRRYRPAAPEGVVLTKLDETGRLGSALSVAVRHGLTLAYTTHGQQVPSDIDTADATRLAQTLEKLRRAADNPLATEDRHAIA